MGPVARVPVSASRTAVASPIGSAAVSLPTPSGTAIARTLGEGTARGLGPTYGSAGPAFRLATGRTTGEGVGTAPFRPSGPAS